MEKVDTHPKDELLPDVLCLWWFDLDLGSLGAMAGRLQDLSKSVSPFRGFSDDEDNLCVSDASAAMGRLLWNCRCLTNALPRRDTRSRREEEEEGLCEDKMVDILYVMFNFTRVWNDYIVISWLVFNKLLGSSPPPLLDKAR